jgi:hypothetical protein
MIVCVVITVSTVMLLMLTMHITSVSILSYFKQNFNFYMLFFTLQNVS